MSHETGEQLRGDWRSALRNSKSELVDVLHCRRGTSGRKVQADFGLTDRMTWGSGHSAVGHKSP